MIEMNMTLTSCLPQSLRPDKQNWQSFEHVNIGRQLQPCLSLIAPLKRESVSAINSYWNGSRDAHIGKNTKKQRIPIVGTKGNESREASHRISEDLSASL
jgi:hypothetical protein